MAQSTNNQEKPNPWDKDLKLLAENIKSEKWKEACGSLRILEERDDPNIILNVSMIESIPTMSQDAKVFVKEFINFGCDLENLPCTTESQRIIWKGI